MTPSRYRPRRLTLANGREVTLRAIRESDAAEIAAAFERLSADSRYARFMPIPLASRPKPGASLRNCSATFKAPRFRCPPPGCDDDWRRI